MSYKIVKLGEICDFQGGSQPPKSNFIFEPKKDYIRFIQIRDFKSDKNSTYIPISKKNNICKNSDILIGRYGASVGKILTGLSGAYNVALMKTIPNEKIIDKKFLYYYLISDLFQEPLKKISERSAQNGFSKDNIYDFSFALPPIEEQQHIVAKLDVAFAEINKIADIEFKKKETTKFLIEKINDNIFDKLKRNSKSIKLSSVIKFENGDRGKNYPSKKYQLGAGIPFINAGDLSLDGEITQKGMVYISKERFNLLGAGKIEVDDILFCLRGSLGKCALNKTYKKGAIASSLVIMRPEKKKILPKYLLAYLRSGIIKEFIKNTAGGTAQPNLSAKTVSNYEIPLPSIEMQEFVLNKIEIIKEEYFTLRKIMSQKRDEFEKLKSAILKQKLQPKKAA
jgi:type I restriction enzyme, S subunit